MGVDEGNIILFLIFSVLVADPKKLPYTVADLARGLLNWEKSTKEKVLQRTTPPSCSFGDVCINGVRLSILLVVRGKLILPCPRSRLRIFSREMGSAVPSRVNLLILHTQIESGMTTKT